MKELMPVFCSILMLSFPGMLLAENPGDINTYAEKFNCTPLGEIEDKPYFLSRISSWSVTSEHNKSIAKMFWCKNPGSQRDFKIVVISEERGHPWSQCPPTIERTGGLSPLNLSLKGLAVSGEYDRGGYLFSCNDGKWDIRFSD